LTFQPSSVLFDKGVIRRVYERRARLAQGLQPTSLQNEAADVYDRINTIAQRLYITQPTANVLRLRPPRHAAAILSDTRVLRKGRYLRRWARRLRDFNFSREDALIIAHGSFGADVDSLLIGVDVIVTNDFKLVNNFKAQYTNIEDRFKRMISDLLDPYSSLKLPEIMTTADVLDLT